MILLILGTRPEALKLLPLLREFSKRKVAFQTVITGQHQHLLAGTGLKADKSLYLPSANDPLQYAADVEKALPALHGLKEPSWVVVQGDTASAVGGARWAVQQGYPLCHVEAGLRSHDLDDPWPEEDFRVEIDKLAHMHCCPTQGNRRNLFDEHLETYESLQYAPHVTGNTIVDQLRHMRVKREPGSHVLVTLHRREAFGEPLRAILNGLCSVARRYPDTPFLWPVHPNPHVLEAWAASDLPPNVLVKEALPYERFIRLLASAKAILTDSGGVVEEACTLGIPTVIARDKTERPEAVASKAAILAGKDARRVEHHLVSVLGHEARWSEAPHGVWEPHTNLFGDGHAAERIAELLLQ